MEVLIISASLASIVTVLIVLFQTWLMFRQTSLVERQIEMMQEQTAFAQRQLDIVQRQDKLMQQQLLRRADLKFDVHFLTPSADNANTRIRLGVTNAGSKTSPNFYWHLLVPIAVSERHNLHRKSNGDLEHHDIISVDGVTCRHFSDFFKAPLYPTRHADIGELVLDTVQSEFKILWQLVADDGVFPDEKHYGCCSFNLPATQVSISALGLSQEIVQVESIEIPGSSTHTTEIIDLPQNS